MKPHKRIKRKYFKLLKDFIGFLCDIHNIDMLTLAYNKIGILISSDGGEDPAIKNVVSKYMPSNPILFDVGANFGNYSKMLKKYLPESTIFAFEPNMKAFEVLKNNLSNIENIKIENVGLGSQKKDNEFMYTYSDVRYSAVGTLQKDSLKQHMVNDKIEKINIKIDTIDNYCHENKINKIDFIKIDTEGYELEILKGALSMIKNDKMNIIQFEFNEMNIYGRVFLKDFYEILNNYNFYRLTSKSIIPLGEYQTINEIFKIQNILAIKKNIDKFIKY